MRTSLCILLLLSLGVLLSGRARAEEKPLRPPTVPLVAVDPYFSIWSRSDKLAEVPTTHWTGQPNTLAGLVRIDNKAYRVIGVEPQDVPALEQKSVTVLPTRSVYEFAGGGVALTLTFMTPVLPDDLMILSRPVTYLTWTAKATDGKQHSVATYFDAAADLVANDENQEVAWGSNKIGGLNTVQMGSVDQPVLRQRGDQVRINWGYAYAAVKANTPYDQAKIARAEASRQEFATLAPAPEGERWPQVPIPAKDAPVMVVTQFMAKVGSAPVSRWMMLAYDDVYSVQYFHKNLKAYWKKDGAEIQNLLPRAAADYDKLVARCARFDQALMDATRKAGGEKYARICALAYRQSFAASKVVADENGQSLFFPKENSSNGCMGTVDVFYPQAPLVLFTNTNLAKAMLVPILAYAASDRWKFPFAPHDIGTWPQANGQVYGGGERNETNQMPVEETGNMLLLLAAVARVEGNADFAGQYWPVLVKWAEYLKSKGFDPENQLCTDDFAGHLAHNINLSAKAICALGAMAKLAEMRGEQGMAAEYAKTAKEFAARWVKEADDGDHFRLTFDKPGSWSQKYNLIWDRILGLNLFPDSVLRKEMDFYKKTQNAFGLPLDSRKDYTKLDWTLWTATLTGDAADFAAIVAPVYKFLDESESRMPMSDWYDTKTGKVVGFISRSVVGGVYAKMLYDLPTWKKWAGQDKSKAANWAPLPKPPRTVTVIPTGEEKAQPWKFTTQRPGRGWNTPAFDDSKWQTGQAGFGADDPPNTTIRTPWKTNEIWLRREVELPAKWNDLQLRVYHDEDVEVFINGLPAAKDSGYVTEYVTLPINRKAYATLKPGKNLLAVHCKQTRGGQFIDVGIVDAVAQ